MFLCVVLDMELHPINKNAIKKQVKTFLYIVNLYLLLITALRLYLS